MQTQVKFIVGGANSIHGGFSEGDIIRCDAAIAAHYIAEGVAVYTESAKIEAAPAPVKPMKKVK